jgi:hypothetical protein
MKNKYLIWQTVSALTCKDWEVEDWGTLETVVVERFSENADYFWSWDNEYLFY